MNQEHFEILKRGVEEWNEWRVVIGGAEADLSGANLSGAKLEGANLLGTKLNGADLSGADLSRANLFAANLFAAKLNGANLSRAYLNGANLEGANLLGTILNGADLNGADLNGANLFGAKLEGANLRGVNLNRANLEEVNLNRANLEGANLEGANLLWGHLSGAKLEEVNLSRANLSGAKLEGANLSGANLSGAKLSRAKLEGANFVSAKLINVDFSNSTLGKTIFGLTNLSDCKGLETVFVSGECVIDFQTLQNSKNIPRTFLKKIGISELLIDYLPEFEEKPINLFPVFLSHSWANKDFAGKLYETLIEKGVKVWYDEKKIKPGDVILESIHKGINLYDKMILVCSEQVLNSWWVKQELERIFAKERQYEKGHGKEFRLLIPITIDKAIHESNHYFATSIKERAVGDFQGWQDEEKFNTAVNKLIDALNVDRGDDDVVSFL